MMKECSYCGTKYPESDLSCPGCGANAVVPEPEKKVWQKMMDYGTSRYGATRQPENRDSEEKEPIKDTKFGIGRLVGCIVFIAVIVLFARAWINNHGPEAEARAAQEKLMKQQYKTAKEHYKDKGFIFSYTRENRHSFAPCAKAIKYSREDKQRVKSRHKANITLCCPKHITKEIEP